MKPGRPLDAAVAQAKGLISQHDYETLPEHQDDGAWRHIPHYSTELADSMELYRDLLKLIPFAAIGPDRQPEELLAPKGEDEIRFNVRVRRSLRPEEIPDPKSWVIWDGAGCDDGKILASGETIPHAVALAFIKCAASRAASLSRSSRP